MTGKRVSIGDRVVHYQVRPTRGRHIRLTVRGDEGLIVFVPRGLGRLAVEEALHRHSAWILRMIGELEAIRRLAFSGGSPRTLLHGKWLQLRFSSVNQIVHDGDGKLLLPLDGRVVASTLLRDWYRRRAKEEFGKLAKDLAHRLGVGFNRLQVREQRTLWGSFSCRGTLSLNWRLVMTPPEVCRYVVVHELAHARHMNHSRQFWHLVARYSPNYREHIRWLQRHRLLLEMLSTFRHVNSPQDAG